MESGSSPSLSPVWLSAPWDPSQLQPGGLGKRNICTHLCKTALTALRHRTQCEILPGVYIALCHSMHMGCDDKDTRLGLATIVCGSFTQSRKLGKILAAPQNLMLFL